MKKLQQAAKKALALWYVLLAATASYGQAQDMTSAAINAVYQSQNSNPLIKYILKLDKGIKDNGAIVGALTAQHLDKLPIGIVDPSGSVMICIDSAKAGPNGATFNAYAAISIPGFKTKMCFRATNVPFGPNGISSLNGSPGITLTLVSTHVLPGKKVDWVLPGNGNNNITFDCNGFKEANLEANIYFKDFMFVPDPVEAPGTGSVKATVKFEHIVNLKNMVASLSITPFKVKGMEDFAFKVSEATLDMSDYSNPAGFSFPSIYQTEYGSNMNLWRGFYLRNLQVRTPFNKGGGNLTLGVDNMLIDDHGFSGLIYGHNLLDIGEGSMGGWSFSMDTARVELLRSKLMGGSLAGGMRVPFLGGDSLGYRATVSQWNGELEYSFRLGLREDKVFKSPVGDAKVRIKSGSYVEVGKYQGKFLAAACLHGKISKDDGVAKFGELDFENVRVSTRSPYLHSGTFALDGVNLSANLGGFEISLSRIAFGLDSGKAVLGFTAGLGLSDEADRSFGIAASFKFRANMVTETQPVERHRWEFAGVTVDSASIKVETGAFDLDGVVRFYQNDGVYGNGFKGALSLVLLKSSLNIHASAGCYFGKKNGLKYWQVSAYVSADSWGIPIVPGVVYMNGFMGGVSYHMKRNTKFFVTPNMMDSTTYQPVSSPDQWARQTYVPDANSSVGILIGTSLYAVNAKLLSASVALEIGLNSNGGLNFIQFNGYATLFKNIADIPPSSVVKGTYTSDAAFTATVSILYDRPNKTFHANVAAYMDLVVLKGAGPQNMLGELVIHADPNQWYVYVGRPSSPVGVKLALGRFELATVQSYFMFGKLLEPFPAPPSEVSSVINYSPNITDGQLRNGSGVAFGARFRAGIGIDWGWLYAGIWVGAGGDVMFSNSDNATCDGSPVGFGGWWARGQVYAWLQGGVGVRVKIFGKKREFKILELTAAVLLEAKVPKPSWFRGHVGVRWCLLGGLIKGNISMSVKLGKECTVMTGTGITDETPVSRDLIAKVMTGISPNHTQTGVSIYSTPAIATNIPVDSVFSQLDDLGNEQKYKMQLTALKMYKGTEEVSGYLSYSPNKKMAYFVPHKKLLPDAEYRVQATLYCRKQLPNTGYWTSAVDEDGNPQKEDTVYTFKTAPPSDVLTPSDIDYAYPLAYMKNFYKAEYTAGGGYIQVNNNVDFNTVFYPGTPGSGTVYDYRFKLASVTPGDNYQTNYQVINRNGHRLTFNLPGIENGKVYRLSIVRIAEGGGTDGMAGGATNGQTVNSQGFSPGDSSVAFTDTTVSNVITGQVSLKETEVLGYYFRVSKFNTFTEKINTMTAVAENQQDLAEGNVVLIATKNNIEQELFDEFEIGEPFNTQGTYDEESMELVGRQLGGGTEDGRLIHLVAETDNLWMENDIMPLIYPRDISSTIGESYYRDVVAGNGLPNYSGIVPVKKITVEHSPKPSLPNTSDPYERMNVTASQLGSTKMMLKYNLPFFANRDFTALYIRALALWVTAPLADKTVTFSRMVATGGIFPQIRTGSYMIKFSYHLPGSTSPSAVKVLPVVYQ